MATIAFLLMNAQQNAAVEQLFDPQADANVIPRPIDNLLANQLGDGILAGTHFVAPARLLNDPEYSRYITVCSEFPIRTWDTDVLFLPEIIEG